MLYASALEPPEDVLDAIGAAQASDGRRCWSWTKPTMWNPLCSRRRGRSGPRPLMGRCSSSSSTKPSWRTGPGPARATRRGATPCARTARCQRDPGDRSALRAWRRRGNTARHADGRKRGRAASDPPRGGALGPGAGHRPTAGERGQGDGRKERYAHDPSRVGRERRRPPARARAQRPLSLRGACRSIGARGPFRGLAPFDSAQAEYFFGRERLVAELVARLVGSTLMAVVGPSGSGESWWFAPGSCRPWRTGSFRARRAGARR